MNSPEKFVSYIRVSTERQGKSGLGLEAQQQIVASFIDQTGGLLIGEFLEIESGKRNSRVELVQALQKCKENGAILLIAKLDRLARNVHFISGLIESGVPFRAVDMPEANRFVLHIMAAVAEHEGRVISERTKAALAAAKQRGVRLGQTAQILAQKKVEEAEAHALQIGPVIATHKSVGLSVRKIAECLNNAGVPSYGGGRWHPTAVQRLWKRYTAKKHITNGNTPYPPCQNSL